MDLSVKLARFDDLPSEVASAGGPALVLATTNWCGHSLAAAELWAELERGVFKDTIE